MGIPLTSLQSAPSQLGERASTDQLANVRNASCGKRRAAAGRQTAHTADLLELARPGAADQRYHRFLRRGHRLSTAQLSFLLNMLSSFFLFSFFLPFSFFFSFFPFF